MRHWPRKEVRVPALGGVCFDGRRAINIRLKEVTSKRLANPESAGKRVARVATMNGRAGRE
jgi:hypothetical protein